MRRTQPEIYKYRGLALSGNRHAKRRFKAVIITKSALVSAVCLISAITFIFTALAVFKEVKLPAEETVLKVGMADAVPFLSFKKENTGDEYIKILKFVSGVDFSNPLSIVAYASPMFDDELPQENEDVEKAVFPQRESEIAELNSASVDLKINNESKYDINEKSALEEEISFGITPGEPTVLIVHTHGSESYTPSEAYSYEQSGNYRTKDTKYNMIRVGEELAKHLEKSGVSVIHDKTINDYPSYNDSYNKTEKVILENLKKYPTIRFVFDIHRDAVGDSENKIKFVSSVNGEKAAQVMIVCGSDENLENPNWRKNLSLALKIQNYFENEYPTFMRPVNLRKERFNMHLTTGSLLFEIGTNSNTLDEALASARYLGMGLAEVIKTLE